MSNDPAWPGSQPPGDQPWSGNQPGQSGDPRPAYGTPPPPGFQPPAYGTQPSPGFQPPVHGAQPSSSYQQPAYGGYQPPPGGAQSPPGYQGTGYGGYQPPPQGYQQPYAGWYAPPEPPGPAPGVAFAPHGERLVAYIIDSVILLVVILAAMVVLFGVAAAGGRSALGPGAVLVFLVVVVVSIGYFPFFWARGGQTPGMRLFGLYVVRDADGGAISTGQALLRLVGFWINGLALYIGWIWVFVDARRRGWHDLIAGTLVVKRS